MIYKSDRQKPGLPFRLHVFPAKSYQFILKNQIRYSICTYDLMICSVFLYISPKIEFGKKHLEKLATSLSREFERLFNGGSR